MPITYSVFDFFVFLKGTRVCGWGIRDISIGGKNFTDVIFSNIGNQVTFIDSIKYFQQRLALLAKTMRDEERKRVKNECKKFSLKDPKLNKKFKKCSEDDQE